MLIDALLTILPPPPQPVDTGDEAGWRTVSSAIGVRPPEDYVFFITLYGTGVINDFLHVYNPFARNPHLNLLATFGRHLFDLRELKSESPSYYPFPIYFEPGGVLPWGVSIDGDLYCWRTTGLTGRWTTTVIPRHSDVEDFPVGMTVFLAGLLSGSLTSAAFPELSEGHRPVFTHAEA
jgi:hypothetical protein